MFLLGYLIFRINSIFKNDYKYLFINQIKNIYNIFDDPFKQSNQLNKKPELSVHEQKDGVIYGVCCTGTNTKQSVIDWTKFLAETNPNLEKYVIVYRIKDKPGYLAILDNNDDKNK